MKNLVVMFPGQGSQAVGMGCDLAAADPAMREAYAEASEVLGYDLQDLCCQGPIDRLSRTDFTQPALLAASVGMFRILQRDGLRFDAAIGHSLGEFSALVATGAVDFKDALRIVRRRGQEMLRAADANPGGMAAIIGLDDAVVEALCAEQDGVWPANFNCPGQVVVSGTQGRRSRRWPRRPGPPAPSASSRCRSAAPSTRRSSRPRSSRCARSSSAPSGARRTRPSSPAARSATRPTTSTSCCRCSSSRRSGSASP